MALKDDLVVRAMISAEERELVYEWARTEGWWPGVRDADLGGAVDATGWFCGELLGKGIVSVVCGLKLSPKLGFIGLYICDKAYRGQGLALPVFNLALAYLGPDRNIALDAVEEQVENYAKNGFVPTYKTWRLTAPPHSAAAIADAAAGATAATAAADAVAAAVAATDAVVNADSVTHCAAAVVAADIAVEVADAAIVAATDSIDTDTNYVVYTVHNLDDKLLDELTTFDTTHISGYARRDFLFALMSSEHSGTAVCRDARGSVVGIVNVRPALAQDGSVAAMRIGPLLAMDEEIAKKLMAWVVMTYPNDTLCMDVIERQTTFIDDLVKNGGFQQLMGCIRMYTQGEPLLTSLHTDRIFAISSWEVQLA